MGGVWGPGQGPQQGQGDNAWGAPQPGEPTWGGQLGGQPAAYPPGSQPGHPPQPGPPPGYPSQQQPGYPPQPASPPPYGAPPPGPYGPYGPGGAPAPGGSKKFPTLLVGGIAAVLVLALIGGLLALSLGGGDTAKFDDPAARQARIAAKDLSAAAGALIGQPAVRYEGAYYDSGGEEVPTTAQLTAGGWLLATLETADGKIEVLSNGPRTYVKGGKSYWERNGAPEDSLSDYGKQWVRVRDSHLGIDLRLLLAPGILGGNLAVAVDRREVSGGKVTTLDDVEVREVITPLATVYVATAEPRKIVRIVNRDSAASPSPSATSSGQGGALPRYLPAYAPADREFEFDLTGLTSKEAAALVKEFNKRVRDLKDSIDSEIDFRLDSAGTLRPCNPSSCTANITIRNEVSSNSSYLAVKQPVYALVTITMTLDGRTVKTCKITKKMNPNTAVLFKCRATYSIPADGRRHEIRARMKAVAKAIVEADLKKLFDDLKGELQRAEEGEIPWQKPADGDLGPDWEPCAPAEITNDRFDCADRVKDIQKRIGGEIKTIKPYPRIGTTKLGPYNGYSPNWTIHEVVVKDGRVYDAWTGRYGESVDVYKQRWAWADMLRFDF